MSAKKIIRHTLLILFACFVLYIANIAREFYVTSLVSKNNPTAIKVYPNQQASVVVNQLYQQKIIDHPVLFAWLITASGKQLHFGEYQIQYPTTAWTLFKNMIKGTGLVKHRFTIIEGWTMQNIRAALSHDNNLNHITLTQTNQAILQKLSATQTHAEGLFYPDTYIFTWGNTDFSVLKTAYQKMQTTLQKAWDNRAPNLPYQNAYDALIVASMIERETAVVSEKPEIASVILNRLTKHMRLQIDPTVQYGLDKNFNDVITKKDLESKTPYNTYQINGLPPSPICMPSESSILAALHPAKTDYFYYVANGTGGHTFSATYAEHEKAVIQYRTHRDS